MINEKQVRKFCKDYIKIENYEVAVNDKTQVWVCHHILGEILSSEQLKAHDFYYGIPPCMLKFVTKAEHRRIHNKSRTGKNHPFYGKRHTEESRKKISESLKGENNPMYGRTGENNPFYGKTHSKESRKKISEAKKGKQLSEEHRRKLSEAMKGKHHSEEHRKKISESVKSRLAKEVR